MFILSIFAMPILSFIFHFTIATLTFRMLTETQVLMLFSLLDLSVCIVGLENALKL